MESPPCVVVFCQASVWKYSAPLASTDPAFTDLTQHGCLGYQAKPLLVCSSNWKRLWNWVSMNLLIYRGPGMENGWIVHIYQPVSVSISHLICRYNFPLTWHQNPGLLTCLSLMEYLVSQHRNCANSTRMQYLRNDKPLPGKKKFHKLHYSIPAIFYFMINSKYPCVSITVHGTTQEWRRWVFPPPLHFHTPEVMTWYFVYTDWKICL